MLCTQPCQLRGSQLLITPQRLQAVCKLLLLLRQRNYLLFTGRQPLLQGLLVFISAHQPHAQFRIHVLRLRQLFFEGGAGFGHGTRQFFGLVLGLNSCAQLLHQVPVTQHQHGTCHHEDHHHDHHDVGKRRPEGITTSACISSTPQINKGFVHRQSSLSGRRKPRRNSDLMPSILVDTPCICCPSSAATLFKRLPACAYSCWIARMPCAASRKP